MQRLSMKSGKNTAMLPSTSNLTRLTPISARLECEDLTFDEEMESVFTSSDYIAIFQDLNSETRIELDSPLCPLMHC